MFGHAIDVGQRDFADGIDVLFRRIAAFRSKRARPHVGKAGNGVALKLGLRNFAALGRVHQILRHAVSRILRHDLAHLGIAASASTPDGNATTP